MNDEHLGNPNDLIPLVAVIGPTGVGKTALGVELAQTYDGEIVSVDSRQFYRYMDIGTAKPTPAELAAARHHLVDFADPDETVGLAQFLQLARAAIREIATRERLPILVGGTGQYFRALLRGWQVPNVPPDPELREELERAAENDPEGLWDRLMALDPDAEAFIHPNNLRRVIRALEVTLKSGVPFSELRRRVPPPYHVLKIGLTMDRDALYARVDARVDAMVAQGLVEEVKSLLERGYSWEIPAMSGLGYIQFRPYLEGEASLEDVIERIKLDTHDFIRRQYTWFRPTSPDVHWLDASDPDHVTKAKLLVAEFLSTTDAGTVGRDREH
ncbi:MAG: tRNA (adenosine(37)-N6)-dimethylallyltransferase MiaA [Anaerolineae bacterium]